MEKRMKTKLDREKRFEKRMKKQQNPGNQDDSDEVNYTGNEMKSGRQNKKPSYLVDYDQNLDND